MRGYNVLFPAGIQPSGLPTIAFSMKVKRNDPVIIEHLRSHGIPDNIIKKLEDPFFAIEFFRKKYMEMWLRMGFSIDVTREICSIDPEYQRFIEWQFHKLYKKGLLIRKPHYIPYCPVHGPVAVDPSETDIARGGNAEIIKFTIIKFNFNEYILPVATMRPETLFGVINIWINPEAEYVMLRVNDEKWIVSKEAASKVKYQKNNVELTRITFKGNELIGKFCQCPVTKRKIPILPALFVDPDVGTGIVMSVPAHDPYDYINFTKIKKEAKWRKIIGNMKPIVIIKTNKYSGIPAEEIIKEKSENIEKAKQDLYRLELTRGRMLGNCGEISGLTVVEARERIRKILIENDLGDDFLDFSEKVICRCGARVYIKRIEDQWFIRYSNNKVKEMAHKCANRMTIKPDFYAENIHDIINWYDDRACARKGKWLGTPLPFDREWIIEPISDSTIYPAMYIIAKYVNSRKIKPEQLTLELLDYVFLGIGDPKELSGKIRVNVETIINMRKEFEYWYPVDMNCGGKEHMSVHFPAYIFNHVAIFPEKYWPRGIFVNWWVIGKSGKISKSKGGAEPVPNLLDKFTADGIRLYYAHLASPHDDIVWDEEVAKTYKKKIIETYKTCETLIEIAKKNESQLRDIDKWILSRINKTISQVTQHMENYEIREASHIIFFEFQKDINWWLKRGGNNSYVAEYVLERWIKMMAPFTPHLAEEFWWRLGRKEYVSTANWPKCEEELINDKVEITEDYIIRVIEDVNNIIKAIGRKPNRIIIYTAPEWTWEVLECIIKSKGNFDRALKELSSDLEKIPRREIISVMRAILRQFQTESVIRINEEEVLYVNKGFLEKVFNCVISINSNYDPLNKRKLAIPYKPAIYIE